MLQVDKSSAGAIAESMWSKLDLIAQAVRGIAHRCKRGMSTTSRPNAVRWSI
jgi:hypothetical protein